MFVCVLEDLDMDQAKMSVKIITAFANLSPLSLREFVHLNGCQGENIKKGKEYLVIADWKIEGRRGKLEMVFMRRWGGKMKQRYKRWRVIKHKCK